MAMEVGRLARGIAPGYPKAAPPAHQLGAFDLAGRLLKILAKPTDEPEGLIIR